MRQVTGGDALGRVRRLHQQLERMGVIRRLRDLGAQDGDTVRIGKEEFDFID